MGQPEKREPAKEFERLVRSLDRHQPWRVFADFAEMGALSLANRVFKNEERERRYMEIIGRYEKPEQDVFGQLLACVCIALGDANGEVDFLGSVFQSLEMSNHWKGQFFTPFEVCRLMAEMTLDGVEDIIRARGFVTMQEPACGAGAMCLAAAAALRRRNIDPSMHMWLTAIDVDPTAAHMCFIQLALSGVPAEVVIGDTISLEVREVFRTPMHWLGLWDARLKARWALDKVVADEPAVSQVLPPPPPPPPPSTDAAPPSPEPKSQLRLF